MKLIPSQPIVPQLNSTNSIQVTGGKLFYFKLMFYCILFVNNLIVSEPSCGYPVSSIKYQTDYLSPAIFQRSSNINIFGNPFFDCAVSFNYNKTWVAEKVIKSTNGLTVIGILSLAGNSAATLSTLYFSSNTIEYGMYRFTLTVAMSFVDPFTSSFTVRTSSQATFIMVVVTGISVFQFGQSSYTIGSSSILDFNAVTMSFDPDRLAVMSQLNFTFQCQLFNSTNLTYITPDTTDLYTLQTTSSWKQNQSCFVALSSECILLFLWDLILRFFTIYLILCSF